MAREKVSVPYAGELIRVLLRGYVRDGVVVTRGPRYFIARLAWTNKGAFTTKTVRVQNVSGRWAPTWVPVPKRI